MSGAKLSMIALTTAFLKAFYTVTFPIFLYPSMCYYRFFKIFLYHALYNASWVKKVEKFLIL